MIDVDSIVRKRRRLKSTIKVFCKMFPPKDNQGKVVYDIGCRTGFATWWFEKNRFKAVGTDVDEEYVKYANKKRADTIVDDIMNTKLPPNSADFIFSRHVIEHLASPSKFLDICSMILRPEGRIFLTFPLEKKSVRGVGYHLSFIETMKEFEAIVNKSAFSTTILDYSINRGIIPDKNEILFVGTNTRGCDNGDI